MFLLHFWRSLPKVFGKILLMSGLVFFGFVLSSSFFFFLRRRRFSGFFFKRYRSGSNRTPPSHALVFLFFFFFVSRRFFLFRPFWPCVPLLGVFPGCHSGPRAFLGFSLNLWGLSLLARPFRGPFLGTRGGKGFLCFFCLVFFFPFSFCGHTFSRRPGVVSLTRRVVLPTPRRSDSQGKAQSWAGALDALFLGILLAFLSARGS